MDKLLERETSRLDESRDRLIESTRSQTREESDEKYELLKVTHPPMLRAIAASKKKNDRVGARMLADLLRCDLLPECYMAPTSIRELRRVLRYRDEYL